MGKGSQALVTIWWDLGLQIFLPCCIVRSETHERRCRLVKIRSLFDDNIEHEISRLRGFLFRRFRRHQSLDTIVAHLDPVYSGGLTVCKNL